MNWTRYAAQVWMNDADASWYCGLRENRADGANGNVGLAEAHVAFTHFLRKQLCRLLMRGHHLNLLEALLLIVPQVSGNHQQPSLFPSPSQSSSHVFQVPRSEREELLLQMRTCFQSDAAALASVSHQCSVLQKVISAALAESTTDQKRSFALSLARRQFQYVARTLQKLSLRAHWADYQPVRTLLKPCSMLATLHCAHRLLRPMNGQRRCLDPCATDFILPQA